MGVAIGRVWARPGLVSARGARRLPAGALAAIAGRAPAHLRARPRGIRAAPGRTPGGTIGARAHVAFMKRREHPAHAVILAGGRGTRFWPRSRTRTPKQLLNIVGSSTMLEQTLERLAPLFPPANVWVVTNAEQAAAVRRQAPRLAARHILTE